MKSQRPPFDRRILSLLCRIDDWISANDIAAWSALLLVLSAGLAGMYLYSGGSCE